MTSSEQRPRPHLRVHTAEADELELVRAFYDDLIDGIAEAPSAAAVLTTRERSGACGRHGGERVDNVSFPCAPRGPSWGG